MRTADVVVSLAAPASFAPVADVLSIVLRVRPFVAGFALIRGPTTTIAGVVDKPALVERSAFPANVVVPPAKLSVVVSVSIQKPTAPIVEVVEKPVRAGMFVPTASVS